MSVDLKKLNLDPTQLQQAQKFLAQNPKATVKEVLAHLGLEERPNLEGLEFEKTGQAGRCAGSQDFEKTKQAGRCAGTPDFEKTKQAGRCAGTSDPSKKS
jgi:hypothetical protein